MYHISNEKRWISLKSWQLRKELMRDLRNGKYSYSKIILTSMESEWKEAREL